MDEIFKNVDKSKEINLNHVKGLIARINYKITEENNIVNLGNNKEVYFRDLNNFYMILWMVRLIILIKK